jgi:hypothetical protein
LLNERFRDPPAAGHEVGGVEPPGICSGEEDRGPMQENTGFRAKFALLAVSIAALAGVAVPTFAGASPAAPFNQCPVAGHDTSCGVLITVNPDGTTSVLTDSTQPAMNGTDGALVGVVNDSNALTSSVALSGTGIFAFDGHGVCAASPSPCFSKTEFGPTGYEGPGTSFTTSDANDGSVAFAGGLAPGTSTYFSLESSTVSTSSASLQADIALAVLPVTATAQIPVSPTVASFTDGGSTASPSSFSATISWGDSHTTAGTVSQSGGAGTPYAVAGTHTYATQGNYTTSVTVTDDALALNTATGTSTATVTDSAINAVGVPLPALGTGQAFTEPVATFTDANPVAPLSQFTALIDWGDSSTSAGTITQTGGTGTAFDVSGSHTYGSSGGFTVTVTISDTGGGSAVVTEPATVSGSIIVCDGPGCSGTVTTPTETIGVSTKSTTGSIQIAVIPNNLDCGDSDRHAPQTTTVTDEGLNPKLALVMKVTFLRTALIGPAGAPVEVCYQASPDAPFVDLEGQTVTLGLLPQCKSLVQRKPKVGPCVNRINPIGTHRTITENLVIPAGDPRYH